MSLLELTRKTVLPSDSKEGGDNNNNNNNNVGRTSDGADERAEPAAANNTAVSARDLFRHKSELREENASTFVIPSSRRSSRRSRRSAARRSLETYQRASSLDFWLTFAGVAGNVLEWYDFAIFGCLGDVIGVVFFPPQREDWATIEAFAVFGAAFLMRPIGGVMLGYIGDVYGRDTALIISVFLMAFPTFFMGCLPSYELIGKWAIFLLIVVRLLQGLSVGGQLMSSLVFTLENHERKNWGLYGSYVLGSANFGTLLGGVVAFALRSTLSQNQLVTWGWRLPFLSGVLVSLSGFYLLKHAKHHPKPREDNRDEHQDVSLAVIEHPKAKNPLVAVWKKNNRRALLSSAFVPVLWSGGFYLGFVWLAVFMAGLNGNALPHAFGISSLSLLVSVCCFFPCAGYLSDLLSRTGVMKLGGLGVLFLCPLIIFLINKGNGYVSFFSQSLLGIFLSCWGAPMCAWLVESFEPETRLTSVSIGYNVAQTLSGGLAPAVATFMVDRIGPNSPGVLFAIMAVVSLVALQLAPTHNDATQLPTTPPRSMLPSRSRATLVPTYDADGHEDDDWEHDLHSRNGTNRSSHDYVDQNKNENTAIEVI